MSEYFISSAHLLHGSAGQPGGQPDRRLGSRGGIDVVVFCLSRVAVKHGPPDGRDVGGANFWGCLGRRGVAVPRQYLVGPSEHADDLPNAQLSSDDRLPQVDSRRVR